MNQAMLLIPQLSLSASSSHHYGLIPPLCSFSNPKPIIFLKAPPLIFRASKNDQGQLVTERKTNYYPSLWDYNSMKSLNIAFDEKEYMEEVDMMKQEVRGLIKANQDQEPLVRLELIDAIQQLGLHYHFEAEIKEVLDGIHERAEDSRLCSGLYATGLHFRILRQHGYKVPQDVFGSFMDEAGNFRETLQDDVEGVLGLYEASFLGLKGETIIDKAMDFSAACLRALEKSVLPHGLAVRVDRALTMPMHWRCNRLQVRWFMDVYKEEPTMNLTLLKLAKLDFNILQSIHMKEVHELSRWWTELGLAKLSFSRDVVMECCAYCILMLWGPKYAGFRVMHTKIEMMIAFIDDVYDAYGSLEELELFTSFIESWDITGIDKLPYVMKTFFVTLYNTTNEIGHWSLIEHGINIIPQLQKVWTDQCKAYMVEAKWRYKVLKPATLKEYIDTAAISMGGVNMLKVCFLTSADTLSAETLASISETPRIVYSSSLVFRLANDLATSLYGKNEVDNLKAVECSMDEMDESEEVAQDHIRHLVRETWKTMNEDVFDHHQLSRTFVNACLDQARASQYFYQFGSGHIDGLEDLREGSKADIMSLLIQPVPME